MSIRVTFSERDGEAFAADLKERVGAYFASRHLSQKANAGMVLKTVIMWSTVFVPYVLILAGGLPPLAMLALCIVMGIGMAGVGFSVAHDALHGAYSANPRVNAALGLSFDMLGANGYMWRLTHNVIHHTYTNIHGIDEDLEISPILRLSPHSKRLGIHRWQHLYAPLAYSLATLNWVFVKDFDQFLRRDLGPYQNKRHPASQVATLVVMKLAYYLWTIALPLLVLDIPLWQFAVGYVALHFTAGLILGVVFQLAHVVEQTEHPVPAAGGLMPYHWTIHEMLTTANFCNGNRLLTWYVGGLNHQIEHHLFPKTCSVHYPRIAVIVRELAAKHGVPYLHNPTLADAIGSHWRTLRTLGRPIEAAQAVAVAA